ncbi:MAG: histidyl-tRNA synthetase [Acidobacteriota bacterium]|jgi:histidyl-tRNA synthetase|nr:histidyl-tRNA synthetase [Acidobacteriota bacterium]
MASGKTQPARGMRDFLPADVRRREYVIGRIKEVYERYGFEPLETPAVENIETLLGKYGEEGNQLIFKILKRGEHAKTGEADLALRYDLTVPLARVVAQYQGKLSRIFKRYQIQPVWRADRPARGRFREFYQCDVDVIGSRSMVTEAQLCAAVSEALMKLGFNNFTIRLNHRNVLTGVLEAAGIPSDKQASVLIALDKLDKIGRSGVTKEFTERGISEDSGNELLTFFERISSLEQSVRLISAETVEAEAEAINLSILGRLLEFVGDHDAGARGIDELRQILEFTKASGIGSRVRLDPSLARGLSYYTGAIMEINVPDLAGSLGGGGRYDNLIGMFLGRDIPACGFSLGLERILVVMIERGMFPPDLAASSADVLVTVWDEQLATDSIALARELRDAGLRVDLDLEATQGGWYGYTRSRGIPLFTVIRTDERDHGEVRLVDMRSENPQDQKIERGQVVKIVCEKLGKTKS